MKTKVLIIGGFGFIGKNLISSDLIEDYDVSLFSKSKRKFKKQIKTYVGDINLYEDIAFVMEDFKPNIVLNLATIYGDESNLDDSKQMLKLNVIGTHNIIRLSIKYKINLYINISSSFMYGQKQEACSEEDPLDPFNLYALTKLMSESLCNYYAKRSVKTKFVSLRLFHVYGPYDHDHRLIPYVIRQTNKNLPLVVTKGEQKWDFIFVEDIIRIIFIFIEKSKKLQKQFEIFNIGTGKAYSMSTVVNEILNLMNKNQSDMSFKEYRKNEMMLMISDNKKLLQFIGSNFEFTSINKGLKKTIKYFIDSI